MKLSKGAIYPVCNKRENLFLWKYKILERRNAYTLQLNFVLFFTKNTISTMEGDEMP